MSIEGWLQSCHLANPLVGVPFMVLAVLISTYITKKRAEKAQKEYRAKLRKRRSYFSVNTYGGSDDDRY